MAGGLQNTLKSGVSEWSKHKTAGSQHAIVYRFRFYRDNAICPCENTPLGPLEHYTARGPLVRVCERQLRLALTQSTTTLCRCLQCRGRAGRLLLECHRMKTDMSLFHIGAYPVFTRQGQSLFPPAPRGRFQRHAGRLTRMPAGLENCPSWVVLQHPPWGQCRAQPN